MGTMGDDGLRDDERGALIYLLYESRPPWHAEAACRGQLQVMFARASNVPAAQHARDLCAGCPVSDQCHDAGEAERFGIWAGTRHADGRRTRLDEPAAPGPSHAPVELPREADSRARHPTARPGSRLAYGVAEAAEVLRMSSRELYRRIGAGEIRAVKSGRRTLIPRDELARQLAAQHLAALDRAG